MTAWWVREAGSPHPPHPPPRWCPETQVTRTAPPLRGGASSTGEREQKLVYSTIYWKRDLQPAELNRNGTYLLTTSHAQGNNTSSTMNNQGNKENYNSPETELKFTTDCDLNDKRVQNLSHEQTQLHTRTLRQFNELRNKINRRSTLSKRLKLQKKKHSGTEELNK